MTQHILGRRSLLATCALQLAGCGPAAHPPPAPPREYPACVRVHPVNLVVDPKSLTTAATPRGIDIPIPLMQSVMRSGKDTVWYTGEVCGGAPPVVNCTYTSGGLEDCSH